MKLRNALALFFIISLSFCLMADMFITPAIIPELVAEYGVGADAIGWAGSAFMLLGALVGLVFGMACDRGSRKRLLVVTVLLGEVPCLLTGLHFFTSGFSGFVLMRVLTGIGVGGIYPITFSLLADLVSERHRAKTNALIDVFWGLGMLAGPLLASWALTTAYGWRLSFVLAAAPSFPLLLLYSWLAPEPVRGGSELVRNRTVDTVSTHMSWSSLRELLRNRSNLLIFLQGIPGSLPWGLLPFWIISFYREQRGFDAATATGLWEIFGIATVVGGLAWASAGDWLFNRRPRYVAILCTAGIALGMLPLLALLNITWPAYFYYLLLTVLGGVMISVASSNIRALLMNINPPEQRGKVFAIYNFTDTLGKGLGPAVGGVMLASGADFEVMLNLAVSLWGLCAAIFCGLIFTIDHDREQLLSSR